MFDVRDVVSDVQGKRRNILVEVIMMPFPLANPVIVCCLLLWPLCCSAAGFALSPSALDKGCVVLGFLFFCCSTLVSYPY